MVWTLRVVSSLNLIPKTNSGGFGRLQSAKPPHFEDNVKDEDEEYGPSRRYMRNYVRWNNYKTKGRFGGTTKGTVS